MDKKDLEMSDTNFDVIFIGGGPGGYTGAIRAAQLGMKVAIVEKYKTLGGTCLNVGCIPSKALLDSSEHFEAAQHDLENHGVKVSGVVLDLNRMMERKSKIVKDLTNGVDFLMKKNTGATTCPSLIKKMKDILSGMTML